MPYGVQHDHSDSTAESQVKRGCAMDCTRLHDFVLAHGYGAPTRHAYRVAAGLLANGDDYALAAAELVARGLVKEFA